MEVRGSEVKVISAVKSYNQTNAGHRVNNVPTTPHLHSPTTPHPPPHTVMSVRQDSWAIGVAQLVKVLATKPEDLRSVSVPK